MPSSFGIVDLFAGPGGLGEGFAAFEKDGQTPFHIGISVEKEGSAHRTLRLRAFLREARRRGATPAQFLALHAGAPEAHWAEVDPKAWIIAQEEARCLELGTGPATEAIDTAIGNLRAHDDTILIGGPPCQAYSLVGRARSRSKADYVPEEDHRHYLFREYISVLTRLRPAAFVMENVKGMLSSTVESRLVFEMLMEDLSSLGGTGHAYEIFAIDLNNGRARLVTPQRPQDFIVRAEEWGVPQRRHRVIIAGLRADLARRASGASVAANAPGRRAADVLTLPELRSGLSRADSPALWREEVRNAALLLAQVCKGDRLGADFARLAEAQAPIARASRRLPPTYGTAQDPLSAWIERPELPALSGHETRGHMASDLGRYLFAAVYGARHEVSPKAADFPSVLAPDHANWQSGIFADRFRVQLASEPATTVTSHIAKDGHYFIHPDPVQCRSLTVREAARLQTFPDDYMFLGNRTQQYVQVGNAVPPVRRLSRTMPGKRSARGSGCSPAVGRSGTNAGHCQARRA